MIKEIDPYKETAKINKNLSDTYKHIATFFLAGSQF